MKTQGKTDYSDPETRSQVISQLESDHGIAISWERAVLNLVDGTAQTFICAKVETPAHSYTTYKFTDEAAAINHCINYAMALV